MTQGEGGGRKPDTKRWNEERVKMVAEALATGASSTDAARLLNGTLELGEARFTRNAVLGRMHRAVLRAEGLPVRTRVSSPPRPRRPRRVVKRASFRIKQPYTPQPPRQPVVLPVPANALPLLTLPHRGCRWPVNEASPGEQHLFCASPRGSGEPYCPYHRAKAYAPRMKRA